MAAIQTNTKEPVVSQGNFKDEGILGLDHSTKKLYFSLLTSFYKHYINCGYAHFLYDNEENCLPLFFLEVEQ